ncbi:PP2C family protein-serine/threonine phosphatase [Streptomyces sp. NPDC088337]|uniref:PP2C family protein-serine/threonine phosphatase n=1 Tax=unclassified Streptomyces TaxID=2593676 RepID=UPI003814BDD6
MSSARHRRSPETTPPQLIAPLIAEEVARVGGRDVSILLQDYGQLVLVPLPGRRLMVGDPEPIGDSPAGTAFLQATTVEVPQSDGVRMYLPLLDGSDLVGVMGLTLNTVDDDDRRLLRRLAGLVADMLVTKHSYTDKYFLARRREPMSVAAEIQWSLLPPLAMSVPQAEVAGILEPAYSVAGDSFDYALNEDILHLAIVDAMGHGLDAATMATVAVGAYRHARRADIGPSDSRTTMDMADGMLTVPLPPCLRTSYRRSRLRLGAGSLLCAVPWREPPPPGTAGGQRLHAITMARGEQLNHDHTKDDHREEHTHRHERCQYLSHSYCRGGHVTDDRSVRST